MCNACNALTWGRRQFLTTEMMLDYPGIALDKTVFAPTSIKKNTGRRRPLQLRLLQGLDIVISAAVRSIETRRECLLPIPSLHRIER